MDIIVCLVAIILAIVVLFFLIGTVRDIVRFVREKRKKRDDDQSTSA